MAIVLLAACPPALAPAQTASQIGRALVGLDPASATFDLNRDGALDSADILLPAASPTATATATPSATAAPSASPSPELSPSPTVAASITASPTDSPSPEPTITATPSPSTSPEPSATQSPAGTATASATQSPSATATATPSATASPSPSPTAAPTATASPLPTASPSPTPTRTATPTATASPTPDVTAIPSASPTDFLTATITPTPETSYTATPTRTPATAPAQVVVQVTGDPCAVGTELKVAVQVASNPGGHVPIAASYAIYYPSVALSFLRVEEGDLGPAQAGAETTSNAVGLPNRYRVFATLSNAANTDSTPTAFTAVFQVLPTRPQPYAVQLAAPAGVSTPLVDASFAAIAHTVSSTAGEGLCGK